MSNDLSLEFSGDAAIIRFTRPEIRNPLSLAVIDQLHLALDDVTMQTETKRLIFTGTGESFASGADLREIANVTPDAAAGFARYGQEFMQRVADMDRTTIAAINGWCFGGALDLALACDRRIASPNAQFAHPGVGLGIITGWGGTQRMPRLVGTARASEMFFTAAPIDATRALAIGLIDAISDDPLEFAVSLEIL
jgi:enoyl-CoA hydratase